MRIGERIKFKVWLSQYGRINEIRAILYQLFGISTDNTRLGKLDDELEKLAWRVYRHGKRTGYRIGIREGKRD
jgi:hypothetical protein